MAGDAETTAPQQRVIGRPFQPGQSGNPAGRPKGSRHKLGEAFLEALHADFEKHGVAAVEKVRETKPDQYLKVIASLLPKEFHLNMDTATELTDDELIERIRALSASIAPFLVDGIGDAPEAAHCPTGAAKSSRVH